VTRGGEWKPQISFETFDRCPKIIPKRHTNKSYENSSHQELRDPKDVPQIIRNPTQKTELELETERARNGSQEHRLRAANSLLQYHGQSAAVLYSTIDSPLQYRGQSVGQKLKTNFAEAVLFLTEKQLLQYHGQSGLGHRTVRKYGHHAAKKAQKKNLNSRTVRYSATDCPRIAKQQEQRALKITSSLRSFDLRPNLHQLPRNLVSMITRQ
jgi:hypothetical protein